MRLSLNSLYNTDGIRIFLTPSSVVRDDDFSPVKSEIEPSSQGQPLNKIITFRVFVPLPWSEFSFPRVLLTGELMSGLSHWKSWTVLVKAQEIHFAPAGGLLNVEHSSPSSSCVSTLTCAKDSFNLLDTWFSNSSKTSTENSLNSCRSNWCESDLELKNLYPHRRFDLFPLP